MPQKKKNRGCLIATLSVAGAGVFLFVFLVFCAAMGWLVVEEAGSGGAESTPMSQSASVSAPAVSDRPYSSEFLAACAEIGLDTGEITNWEQIDDWANGERYQFSYKRQSVLAYMNADGTVNSINIGQTHVYEQGYEPYNIEDYIVDEDTAMALIPYAEDTVKLALNYPATADLPFLDWGYGREGDIYILQSTVTATNGFGVPEEIPFTVMFDLSTEGKAICVYLELAGTVVADDRETQPERGAIETNAQESSQAAPVTDAIRVDAAALYVEIIQNGSTEYDNQYITVTGSVTRISDGGGMYGYYLYGNEVGIGVCCWVDGDAQIASVGDYVEFSGLVRDGSLDLVELAYCHIVE